MVSENVLKSEHRVTKKYLLLL